MFFKKRLVLSQSLINKELFYRYNFFYIIIKLFLCSYILGKNLIKLDTLMLFTLTVSEAVLKN